MNTCRQTNIRRGQALLAASFAIFAAHTAHGLGTGGISANVSVGGGGISADVSVGGSGSGSGSSSGSSSDQGGGALADVDVNLGGSGSGGSHRSGGALADVDVNIGGSGSSSGSGGTLADVDINLGSGHPGAQPDVIVQTTRAKARSLSPAEAERLGKLPKKFRTAVGMPVFSRDGVYLGQVQWVGGARSDIRIKVPLVESARLGVRTIEISVRHRDLRQGVIRLGMVHAKLSQMLGGR
ncbi:MAG: hypothetical protein JXQ91_02295 [Vannielia sp.]|uniref:hypothetical protein n=1 Tax=Vannielia sp. TaxID=2813045 RepID=UPI003B8DCBB5